MKITIESTDTIVELNGVDCRVWEGMTAKGIKCHCLVAGIEPEQTTDLWEFEQELLEMAAPEIRVKS